MRLFAAILAAEGVTSARFDEVTPNPRGREVHAGAEAYAR